MNTDLLRKAATLIELRVTGTTNGPWSVERDDPYERDEGWMINSPDPYRRVASGGYEGGGVWLEVDAEWIALMHPGIAAPLVAWLRDIADAVDQYEGYPSFAETAVDFATAILKEDG